MTTSPDPERAQSFRSIGELYHRLRTSYPDQAVDWMLLADQGRAPARVLDLGAGSGKLTDSLVARGLDVVAVDPSRQMLDVLAARLPAVEVHEGGAEELPLPDQCVDAVVVGQAWHWMDPAAAGAELARVLRPGGSVAMAWNADLAVEEWQHAFEEVQQAPRGISLAADDERHPGPRFAPFEKTELHWERPMQAEDFLELHKTHSAWLVASPETRAEREARWRSVLQQHGVRGEVSISYRTDLWRTFLLD